MEAFVRKMAHGLAVRQQLDAEREAIIAYGMLALSQMLCIFLYAVVFGLFTGTLLECLIVYSLVGFMRKFTGGAHAHSMGGCILVSVSTMSIMALVSHHALSQLSWIIMLIALSLYIIYFFIVWKKAPMDTPNKPILKPEKRKRLRKGSFAFLSIMAILSILLVTVLYFQDIRWIKGCFWSILLALGWQTLTLTKWMYLLFT